MKKKVTIIGIVGIPAQYGGFETLTEHLTICLAKNYMITVFCSSKSHSLKSKAHNGAALKYINLKANGFQSILYDIISILKSVNSSDTLLILGVSGCVILPFIKWFYPVRIIVNIDGIEWKRDKWSWPVKWFLKLSEGLAVKYADTIISDNKAIQLYIQNEYKVGSEFIAYGADHVTKTSIEKGMLLYYPFLEGKYFFTVCRIEPENNLDIVLEAGCLQKNLPVVIVGNWNSSVYGKQLREKYSDFDHIYLLDPIYDQKKLNMLRSNCYAYLHGHSAGGTNPSLVEAMHLELPIISYGAIYNKETTNNKALYFSTAQELVLLMEYTSHSDLVSVAQNMGEISKREYSWKKISSQYADLF
jgi:glycosyltransferase involved in cell wall biosynthesis